MLTIPAQRSRGAQKRHRAQASTVSVRRWQVPNRGARKGVAGRKRRILHRSAFGPGATRLSAFLIMGMLASFLLVKTVFRMPHSNAALYGYGVTVTLVVSVQMFVAMFRYRDLAATATSSEGASGEPGRIASVKADILVSCLVAVHNEEDIIERCIRSLVEQTYGNVETIIVDDASTDRTPHILDELANRYPITVIKLTENVGKKKALAAGMLQASGQVFAFTDSDSVWAPDAMFRAVHILEHHPDVGAISGHCRALNPGGGFIALVQDTWYEGQFSIRKAFESVFSAVTCVSGPLAVFRREAIFNFIPAWQSDSFLGDEFRFATDRTLTAFVLMPNDDAKRLRDRHQSSDFSSVIYPWRRWDVVYSKSMRAWTEVPGSFRALMRQQVRWKKSFIRNIFFTGRFYWRRPVLAALAYYLHALFVFAGPVIAFRHLVYMPLHGNVESMILYLFGIVFIGIMFGLAFRREDPANSSQWVYRPVMSLLSTIVLTWLILYSLCTIKRMTWARG